MSAFAYVSGAVSTIADRRRPADVIPNVQSTEVMSALSDLGLGLMTLDAHGRVLDIAVAASRIMAEDLRIELGRLRARRPSADRHLQSFIAASRCAGGASGRRLILPKDDGAPLIIDAVAMPQACLLLVLRRPGNETCRSQAALAEAFGLTAAETRVALVAATGKGGPVIAEDLDVSLSTVRTHLKAVFAKTGTRSQAHLAAILAPLLVV